MEGLPSYARYSYPSSVSSPAPQTVPLTRSAPGVGVDSSQREVDAVGQDEADALALAVRPDVEVGVDLVDLGAADGAQGPGTLEGVAVRRGPGQVGGTGNGPQGVGAHVVEADRVGIRRSPADVSEAEGGVDLVDVEMEEILADLGTVSLGLV